MTFLTFAILAAVLGGGPIPNDAIPVAEATERAVSELGAIPGLSTTETLAVMLVTADEESRFEMARVGDRGRARCAYQVWGPSSLATNVDACARTALLNLRESRRMCPDEPLAQYVGGCSRPTARRISSYRRARARGILKTVRKESFS